MQVIPDVINANKHIPFQSPALPMKKMISLLQKMEDIVHDLDTGYLVNPALDIDLLLDYTRQFYAEARQLKGGSIPGVGSNENAIADAAASHTPSDKGTRSPMPAQEEQLDLTYLSKRNEAIPTTNHVDDHPLETIHKEEPSFQFAVDAPKKTSPEMAQPETMKEAEPIAPPLPTPKVTPPVQSAPLPVRSGKSDELFSFSETRELSDKLRLSKLDDLSKGMGINERFLTINELFNGNHEAFDHALRHLNQLANFAEARNWIENSLIEPYGWLDEKKKKKAQVFIQLVQRKYLN